MPDQDLLDYLLQNVPLQQATGSADATPSGGYYDLASAPAAAAAPAVPKQDLINWTLRNAGQLEPNATPPFAPSQNQALLGNILGGYNLGPVPPPAPAAAAAPVSGIPDQAPYNKIDLLDFLDPATRAKALALDAQGNTPLIMRQGNVLMGPAAISGGRSLAGARRLPMADWDAPQRQAQQYQDEVASAERLRHEQELEDLIAGRVKLPAGYLNPAANRQLKPEAQPHFRPVKSDDDITSFDPTTGKVTVVYKAPPKANKEAINRGWFTKSEMEAEPANAEYYFEKQGPDRFLYKRKHGADLMRAMYGATDLRAPNMPGTPAVVPNPAAEADFTNAAAGGSGVVGTYVPGKGVVYTNQ